MTVDEWLADRREAGLKIDPATAEEGRIYALTLDTYGVHGELPEELQQVGREHFVRTATGARNGTTTNGTANPNTDSSAARL